MTTGSTTGEATDWLMETGPGTGVVPSHVFPVARLFEGVRGPVDDRLIEAFANEHHADRQAVPHAAGNGHGGVAGDIRLAGIFDVDHGVGEQLGSAKGVYRSRVGTRQA